MKVSTLKYFKNALDHPFYRFSTILVVFILFFSVINHYFNIAIYLCAIFFMLAFISWLFSLLKLTYLSLCFLTANLILLNLEYHDYPEYIANDHALIKAEIQQINIKDSIRGNITLKGEIDSKNYPAFKSEILCFYYGDINHLSKGDQILISTKINKDKKSNIVCFSFTNKIAVIGKGQVSEIQRTYASYLKREIYENYCSKTKGIAYSVISADKGNLNPKLKKEFSQTGIAHILTLSGLHVSILVMITYYLLGNFSSKKYQLIITACLVLLFLFLIDFPLSALRASIFALIYLYIQYIQRYVLSINILVVYIVMSLIFKPLIILDISFQMSVSAMLGILLFNQKVVNLLSNLIKSKNSIIEFLINSLSISISASLFLNIVIYHYFGVFSILSPILNMIIVPIFSLSLIYEVFAFTGLDFLFQASDLLYELIIYLNSKFIVLNEYLLEIKSIYPLITLCFVSVYIIESKELKVFWFRLILGVIIFILTLLLFQ